MEIRQSNLRSDGLLMLILMLMLMLMLILMEMEMEMETCGFVQPILANFHSFIGKTRTPKSHLAASERHRKNSKYWLTQPWRDVRPSHFNSFRSLSFPYILSCLMS